jgi:hypothetical protein
MTDDKPRQAPTSPDEYTLTIDDASARYEHAGHPRTVRTIQRYCARGHLDCLRQETTFGDKYLITPASVVRHIAQIDELATTTRRDQPRQAAANVAVEESHDDEQYGPETRPDKPRPVAADYVGRVESEVEFLRGQIGVKDRTIEALLERDRETNILVGQLQKMLTPLLGRAGEPPPRPTGSPEQSAG